MYTMVGIQPPYYTTRYHGGYTVSLLPYPVPWWVYQPPYYIPPVPWWVYQPPYYTPPCTTLGIPASLLHHPAVIIPAGRLHAAQTGSPGLTLGETRGYETQRGLPSPKGVRFGRESCALLLRLPR